MIREFFAAVPGNWDTFFRPKYFFPHLRIISLPRDTPDDVAGELEESFKLLFCSPSSASNHLRIAVENLLTALKVKRHKKGSKQGQRRIRLGLHARIEILPKKHEHLQDLLLAIKWLGDVGSHRTGSITMDDVLDAYEIMEEVRCAIPHSRAAEACPGSRRRRIEAQHVEVVAILIAAGPVRQPARRAARPSRFSIPRSSNTPPSEDSRPPSNRAHSSLFSTGDKPGR